MVRAATRPAQFLQDLTQMPVTDRNSICPILLRPTSTGASRVGYGHTTDEHDQEF
jgi:hypothetical protein